jgi:hypothetical protein
MTDRQDGHDNVAGSGINARSELEARWVTLADQPAPPATEGAVAALANRVLVYLRPDKVETVLPHLDSSRSGLILAGAKAGRGLRLQMESDFKGPVGIDPACYEKYTATCEAPFKLPENQLWATSLGDVLDDQLQAGVTVTFTPTGFISAGATDVLKAAAREVKQLGRSDVIFVVPMDVSLLGPSFIRQTIAILQDVGCPVALVLGRQFDPLDHSKQIIPSLRDLAVSVPLMPMRTDFNALDLIAHGAFAGAIGTGGSVRHTVDPAERPRSFQRKGQERDESPSVLVPDLVCWLRGSKIAKLFGARPNLVPCCDCQVCSGQRLNRFLRREHQHEAIAHGVAVWSRWAADLLAAPTMRERAQYWRNLCNGSLQAHTMFLQQLQLMEGLEPQMPIGVWATLPAWPTEVSTVRA